MDMLPSYISLADAAARLHSTPTVLLRLGSEGKISFAVKVDTRPVQIMTGAKPATKEELDELGFSSQAAGVDGLVYINAAALSGICASGTGAVTQVIPVEGQAVLLGGFDQAQATQPLPNGIWLCLLGMMEVSAEQLVIPAAELHRIESEQEDETAHEETFVPLTEALKDCFDKPLAELPDEKRRLVQNDWTLRVLWDGLDEEQRRCRAAQRDAQHDPATEADVEHGFKLDAALREKKRERVEWKLKRADLPSEQKIKDEKLQELDEDIRALEQKLKEAVASASGVAATADAVGDKSIRNAEWQRRLNEMYENGPHKGKSHSALCKKLADKINAAERGRSEPKVSANTIRRNTHDPGRRRPGGKHSK